MCSLHKLMVVTGVKMRCNNGDKKTSNTYSKNKIPFILLHISLIVKHSNY
jgi:hypothetical protein